MKKLGIVLLLLCIVFAGSPVLAEKEVTVSAQLNVSDFCVDVTADGLTPFVRASVFAIPAIPENTELATALTTALTASSSVYAEQTILGLEGSLKRHIGFLSNAKAGEYVIVIADEATNQVYVSEPFAYRTEKDMDIALGAINKATEETVVADLKEHGGTLLLDTTEYDLLKDPTAAAVMFLKERPVGGFKKPADVHSAFGAAVATSVLKTSENPAELLMKYADALEIDSALLAGCSADESAAAMDVLQQTVYASPDALAKAYPGAIFAGKVNTAAIAGEVRTYFLTTYAKELALDLTKYNKLSNPLQVFVTLMNQKVTGFDDAKDKFDDAVAAQAEAEKEPSGNSTGGFGGGGGAAGGYPVAGEDALQEPVKEESVKNYYTDLADAAWAVEAVDYLTEKGVVSGDGNGLFRPNAAVTRGEFVKMLTLAFNIPVSKKADIFADVEKDAWYSSYVATAVEAGLVKGLGDNRFAPEASITRQDLTLMCFRAAAYGNMELQAVKDTLPTDFATTADYAKDAVQAFFGAEIINGDPNGTFRPQDGATRAEVAKIIAELMQRKETM
ncbi:MAG: S-layer homology domain-containing protein [Clostridia bacterium]|nr:S-layer homology domain-containing protein [Clostridia bacterium]